MRVWVTGAAGFVGRYVCAEFQRAGYEVIGLDAVPIPPDVAAAQGVQVDITSAAALSAAALQHPPDGCVHLAGIAHVPAGWREPGRVMHVNLNGTLNVLEALRTHQPSPRILVVTSSEVYGRDPRPGPIREDDPMTPSNLYGVSKLAADHAARLYYKEYGMPVLTARPQNHIGPGQSDGFVVAAFARQLVQLRTRPVAERILQVGNLESARDFTDVRDVAHAYRLLLDKGHPGEAYNIASGRNYVIQTILDRLCSLAGFTPRIQTDPERYRPADAPPLLAIDKIREQVGWTPQIPLARSLEDIYRHAAG